jgi:hypothetical protein
MTEKSYYFANGYNHVAKEYSFTGGIVVKNLGDAVLVQLKQEWGGLSHLAVFVPFSNSPKTINEGDVVGTSNSWLIGKKGTELLYGKSPAKSFGEILPFKPSAGQVILAAKQTPDNINSLYNNFGRVKMPPGYGSSNFKSSPVWITKQKNVYQEYWYTTFSGKYDASKTPIFERPPKLISRKLSASQVQTAEISYGVDLNNDGKINSLPFDKASIYRLPEASFNKEYSSGSVKQIPYPLFFEQGARFYQESEFDIGKQSPVGDRKFKWMELSGTSGNDILTGSKYIDFIKGGDGNDIIYGGDRYRVLQSDPFYMSGNAGSNTHANANDILTGGKGKDTFIINIANLTWITDFNPVEDRIVLYSEKGSGAGGSMVVPPPSFDQIQVVGWGNNIELLDQNNTRFAYLRGFDLDPGNLNQKIDIFS